MPCPGQGLQRGLLGSHQDPGACDGTPPRLASSIHPRHQERLPKSLRDCVVDSVAFKDNWPLSRGQCGMNCFGLLSRHFWVQTLFKCISTVAKNNCLKCVIQLEDYVNTQQNM